MSFVLWLFEIGYLLQHAATLFQIQRIHQKRNTELISLETNVFFLIGAIARIAWMWDSMLKSFFLAYIEILLGLGTLIYLIYIYNKFKVNNFALHDKKIPIYYSFQVLIPVILILSFFFHPGTKGPYYFTTQMFVSLNIFSEAIGLLPQLWMIKSEKDTGSLSQFYAVFLAVARFFRLLFWFKMYFDGNKFYSLIIADLLHTILLFDFILNIIRNWNKLALPTIGPTEPKPKKMF